MATSSFCPQPAPSLRSRVLSAATELFYRRGFLAVSINEIAAAAGVTKTSLYRYFRSKDALAVACLDADLAAEQAGLAALGQQYASDPLAQLRRIIEEAANHLAEPDYRGWMRANFAVEIADPSHPVRRACVLGHNMLRAHLLAVARQAGLQSPETLADSLLLVLHGAAGAWPVSGPDGPAASLTRTCAMIIASHQPSNA